MARLLRPEKIDGKYLTATAVHAPYQCIDSRTGEPLTHTKDTTHKLLKMKQWNWDCVLAG